jgi:membrane-associated phospholipid phosphatase
VKDKREFRRLAALAGWCVIFLVAALLLLGSFYLDPAVLSWMKEHQQSGIRKFMELVSLLGDWPGHVALGLVLLAAAYWRRNQKWTRIFAAMILACALSGLATRVVKISVGRARPNVQTESSWNGPRFSPRFNSFPSGHTAASTAFFATLAFASWRVGLPFLAVPLLIAFSRMYVVAHHLSDVVCAAMIGAVTAYVVADWKPLQIGNRNSKIEN